MKTTPFQQLSDELARNLRNMNELAVLIGEQARQLAALLDDHHRWPMSDRERKTWRQLERNNSDLLELLHQQPATFDDIVRIVNHRDSGKLGELIGRIVTGQIEANKPLAISDADVADLLTRGRSWAVSVGGEPTVGDAEEAAAAPAPVPAQPAAEPEPTDVEQGEDDSDPWDIFADDSADNPADDRDETDGSGSGSVEAGELGSMFDDVIERAEDDDLEGMFADNDTSEDSDDTGGNWLSAFTSR